VTLNVGVIGVGMIGQAHQVFCEKPLATTGEGRARIVDAEVAAAGGGW
jgi:predicted dehydrogenase